MEKRVVQVVEHLVNPAKPIEVIAVDLESDTLKKLSCLNLLDEEAIRRGKYGCVHRLNLHS